MRLIYEICSERDYRAAVAKAVEGDTLRFETVNIFSPDTTRAVDRYMDLWLNGLNIEIQDAPHLNSDVALKDF